MNRRTLAILTILATAVACRSSTEPVFVNMDTAHATWLANHPSSYSVEEATGTSMIPMGAYYTLRVVNDSITGIFDQTGKPVQATGLITIDSLWSRIYSELGDGLLQTTQADQDGVPEEAVWGLSGGDDVVYYSLRNFLRQ